MTKHVLVLGATGGIGSCLIEKLKENTYQCTGWSSTDLDLNCPHAIFDTDLTKYDIVINAAGHSQGTYLGFQANSWDNQFSQIMVNYVSNLALVKHYAAQCSKGKYVWISTSLLVDGARAYHSVYASSKMACKTAFDLIQKEIDHINIVEITVGPTATNFRHRNFLNSRSRDDVNSMYIAENALTPDYVANQIICAIDQNLLHVNIT
jgi:short-subunit dehydrogenase